MTRLIRDFYNKSAIELSRDLVGKIIVCNINEIKLKCRIVEVEAYMGVIDKASHAYGGKRTNRTEVMYENPGILYVYFIYGMYYCTNIVAGNIDVPEAVLIRALEPLEGFDNMSFNRFNKSYSDLTKNQKINLTNGPGKLSMAIGINKSFNRLDLCKDDFYLQDDGFKPEIVSKKRIGIDYAEEAAEYLWRFYSKDNPYVSKK